MAGSMQPVREPGSVVLREWNARRAAERQLAALKGRRRAPMLRSFAAAEISRLTASFGTEQITLNDDLERSLRILRTRSRHLAKNNDYVRKFLRMCQNHIVGPHGFTLSVPATRPDGSIDEGDKRVCEQAFARWARRGVCDVTGRLSFVQFCRLAVLMLARDGECIVRRVSDRRINGFGYALQMIDPVLLDETYRADLGDGRRIRMGVELNADGRPVAYHFLQSADWTSFGRSRVRVPADEIWHFFLQDEPDQVRGYPWIHTAMRRLNDLGGFEEAAVIAARVGASNMGFFVPPADASGGPNVGHGDSVETDGEGNDQLVRDATPGAFEELPPGYDFKTFEPDYPHANYAAFVKACLRGIASGVGVDYNTLANDLEGVNYSSIRQGVLETRDEWMCLQGAFIEWLLQPLWPEWLRHAFVSGQLDPLPLSKFAKYDVAQWQGRRWPWVDPLKDLQAKLGEIDNALNSYSGVMRELGRDPDAVWRELERDKARIEKLLRPSASNKPEKIDDDADQEE